MITAAAPPDELFAKVAADGLGAVQLAYKKCVPGVKEYADITPELVADTVEAGRRHHVWVGVLGTYVELAIDDEAERRRNLADFKSQLAVCGRWAPGASAPRQRAWRCSRPAPAVSARSTCCAKALKKSCGSRASGRDGGHRAGFLAQHEHPRGDPPYSGHNAEPGAEGGFLTPATC